MSKCGYDPVRLAVDEHSQTRDPTHTETTKESIMVRLKTARAHRVDRHRRVRKKVAGTTSRPRLCTFRSSRHIYAQIIDDSTRRTIISASSLGIASKDEPHDKTQVATEVGSLIASKATDAGISTVVFDRGGYPYHGRIKALADAAREGGLVF